jgi:antirestriction protein ArdC
MKSNKNKTDIYQDITHQIIADLEQGVSPWHQSWAAGECPLPLRFNGEHYHGINVLVLWSVSQQKGYSSPHWLTFNQAKQFGAHVKKGEKSSRVVYFKTLKVTEDDEEKSIPMLRDYRVFNAEQIEGLPEKYTVTLSAINDGERIEAAERFYQVTGADIRHQGNQAFYDPIADYVQIPEFQYFENPQSYYAVLGHELTHWTKHPDRLDRDLGKKSWGDAGYAREELVAEIGAAFLNAKLQIDSKPREDHAAYIGHWIQVLKDDKKFIFKAASMAQKAVEYLEAQQAT